jgi:phosphoribosylformylglycinamidine synthase
VSEACEAFGIPVVSGNVSLYNESAGRAIWPTPVVGMLGLLPDLARRCDSGFQATGDLVVLLGDPGARLDGSEYLSHVHGRVAGRPSIDLLAEVALQRVVREAIGRGLLRSAHDCSDGGLAVAIAESAFRGGLGVTCRSGPLASGVERDDVVLFGEAQSRVVVSLPASDLPALVSLAGEVGVPCTPLGEVATDRLVIGPLDVPLARAREAWEGGLEHSLFAVPEGLGGSPSAGQPDA